jgi:hypothetical protein
VALLTTEMLPVDEPVMVGVKTVENEMLWPAATVAGKVIPLEEKVEPVIESWEIVTLEFPVLERVMGWIEELPTAVLANDKLEELGTSWYVFGAAPVPKSATLDDEFGALLRNVKFPELVEAVVGAKLSVNDEEAPGAIVSGRARPLSVKPEPVIDTWVMLKLAEPEFWTVIV